MTTHCPGCHMHGVSSERGTSPYECPGCQSCAALTAERDALQAATLRLVEALETVNPWCMVSHRHVTCDLSKVQSALADPILVALRRE